MRPLRLAGLTLGIYAVWAILTTIPVPKEAFVSMYCMKAETWVIFHHAEWFVLPTFFALLSLSLYFMGLGMKTFFKH